MTDIVCSDPGHAGRSAQPGWQTVLGQCNGTPPAGMICPACAAAAAAVQAQTDAVLAALAINQAALKDYLASALPTLRTLDTQAKTLSTLTLSGTTAQQLAQTQAALRNIGAGLDTVLTGLVKVARLLSDQLDGTT